MLHYQLNRRNLIGLGSIGCLNFGLSDYLALQASDQINDSSKLY